MNSKFDTRLRIVQTLISALILVSIWLAHRTIAADHDMRRRAFTMDLYSQWREVLDTPGEARETLELLRDHKLKDADLKAIVHGTRIGNKYDEESVYIMRRHLVTVLNLFEQIAVAGANHVGDEQMIRDIFERPIRNNYKSLGAFRAAWTEAKLREGWGPLDRILNEEWEDSESIAPKDTTY